MFCRDKVILEMLSLFLAIPVWAETSNPPSGETGVDSSPEAALAIILRRMPPADKAAVRLESGCALKYLGDDACKSVLRKRGLGLGEVTCRDFILANFGDRVDVHPCVARFLAKKEDDEGGVIGLFGGIAGMVAYDACLEGHEGEMTCEKPDTADDRDPAKLEASLWRACLPKLEIADPSSLQFGLPEDIASRDRFIKKLPILNRSSVTVELAVTFRFESNKATPGSDEEALLAGLDFAAYLGCLAEGNAEEVCRGKVLPRTTLGSSTIVLSPRESGVVVLDTAHVPTGLLSFSVEQVTLRFPNGAVFDPSGCYGALITLTDDDLAERYSEQCALGDVRVCRYLQSVRDANLDRLREFCAAGTDPLSESACIRAQLAAAAAPVSISEQGIATTPAAVDKKGYVLISAGGFWMGTSEKVSWPSDLTRHRVHLTRPFRLKETEVTAGEWQKTVGKTGHSYCIKTDDDCPAMVTWWSALLYCNLLSKSDGFPECYELRGCTGEDLSQLICVSVRVMSPDGTPYGCDGYRLPTEAEWEYGARAGSESDRYDDLDDIAWYDDIGSHPVRGKKPNAWRLWDMIGNQREWVWDWLGDYPKSEVTDPCGVDAGKQRVDRGCDWTSDPSYCTAAYRTGAEPNFAGNGFRPARTIR